LIKGPGARVMSLRDGTEKMSKSDPSDNSRINLTDGADKISKKIRKAKTDAGEIPLSLDELEGRPEVKNLVGIYSALSGKSDQEVLLEYSGKGFGIFKSALADLAVSKIHPITELMNRYLSDPEELNRILSNAADRASEISDPIVAEVRKIIGFSGV
jgi:tryptophanyl-tRNA synthetase